MHEEVEQVTDHNSEVSVGVEKPKKKRKKKDKSTSPKIIGRPIASRWPEDLYPLIQIKKSMPADVDVLLNDSEFVEEFTQLIRKYVEIQATFRTLKYYD